MSDKIEYSRLLMKRSTVSGDVPTVPPITATTLNDFTPNDIFVGEFFLNAVDDLLWIRTDNGILPIDLSGSTGTTVTPNLTQVLFEGNNTGGYDIEVSSGATIIFQGITTGSTSNFLGLDASGNTIVSTVTPGTPDLEDVLSVGNTTGANDISVNIGSKIEGQSAGNWIRPETADGNLEINVDNELAIVGITSGRTDIVLSYDPDTKYVKYQSVTGGGGSSGSAGTSGTSGSSGSSGSSGTSGSSGSSGTSGTNGSNGSSGTSGSSGSSGTSGISGSSGTSGSSGSSGTSGSSGLSGVNGTNGSSGTSGTSGGGPALFITAETNSLFSIYGTPVSYTSSADLSIGIGSGVNIQGDLAVIIGNASQTLTGNESRCVVVGAGSGAGQLATAVGYSTIAQGTYSSCFGHDAQASGQYGTAIGAQTRASGTQSIAMGNFSFAFADDTIAIGQNVTSNNANNITIGNTLTNSGGAYSVLFGGASNTMTSSGQYNAILNGNGNTISGTTERAVMIGTNSRTADTNNCLFVENLKLFNYGSLNFVNDSDAAAGGVVLGQVYHSNGVLKIRIT
jgi:hypothetical protein